MNYILNIKDILIYFNITLEEPLFKYQEYKYFDKLIQRVVIS